MIMKKGYIRKQTLALEYFPDATPHVAVNHLMRWINRCTKLLSELEAQDYRKNKRYFSPTQKESIYYYLGEP